MKIRLQLGDLNDALARVAVVRPANKDSLSAYLFRVADGRCYIYSQDLHDYVRTEVPVMEVQGAESSAAFVYPADRVESLKYLDGWIEIESGETDGRFWTNYVTEGGAKANRTTYDPKRFESLEDALAEAASENLVPTVLLREGLATTSRYIFREKEKDPNRPWLETVQVFDGSNPDWKDGNGTMYAADGRRACYFYSPALVDRGLAVHDKHIPHLTSFLSKCGKKVKLKVGRNWVFVIDQVPGEGGAMRDGSVFGWIQHSKPHPKYKLYGLNYDKFVLMCSRDLIGKTVRHLRYEMKDISSQGKIRVSYQEGSLKFIGGFKNDTVESVTVNVDPQNTSEGAPSGPEFASNVHVDSFLGLFESSKSPNLELRVAVNNNKVVYRTMERFFLGDSGKVYIRAEDAREDVYPCQVTNFIASMD